MFTLMRVPSVYAHNFNPLHVTFYAQWTKNYMGSSMTKSPFTEKKIARKFDDD